MTHERDNSTSVENKNFEDLIQESNSELDKIASYAGLDLFDPQVQKKKELRLKLSPIVKVISKQWNRLITQENMLPSRDRTAEQDKTFAFITRTKQTLFSAMFSIKLIIKLLQDLNKDNEKQLKDMIEKFNKENITELNVAGAELNKKFTTLTQADWHIGNLSYGENISYYMGIGAAVLKFLTMVSLAWSTTLGEAAAYAGHIFYPITASFTASAKLFGLLIRSVQFFVASEATEEGRIHAEVAADDTKVLLRKSAMFRFFIFSLHTLSVLAFAGILATPVGWALVAAATLLEWLDDNVLAAQKANKELADFNNKHPDKDALKKTEIEQLKELENAAAKTNSERNWNSINVIAMILVACAPVPIAGPILAIIGLSMCAIVPIRNITNMAINYFEKPAATKEAAKNLSTETTVESSDKILDAGLERTPAPTPSVSNVHRQLAATEASVAPKTQNPETQNPGLDGIKPKVANVESTNTNATAKRSDKVGKGGLFDTKSTHLGVTKMLTNPAPTKPVTNPAPSQPVTSNKAK
jgi:hypothetical protein